MKQNDEINALLSKLCDAIYLVAKADVITQLSSFARNPGAVSAKPKVHANGVRPASSGTKKPKLTKGKKDTAPANPDRRSTEEIAAQAEKLFGFINDNPKMRAEEISKGTGITTGDLKLPIKHLIAAKKIKAHGVARGTRYEAR